jgi:uncharacterized protein DUF2786
MDRSRLIERVRKLLRLTASNNQFEATRAKEEADAIMRKHGITKDDVAELIIREADAQRDFFRDFLAGLAARFFGCVMVERKTAVGFRGTPTNVNRALQFYEASIRESKGALMPPVAPWLQDAAMSVWTICWWDAFVAAIYERFGRPTVPKEKAVAVPDKPQAAETGSEDPFAGAVEAISQLEGQLDTHWLRHEARKSGRDAATRIEFPLDVTEQKTIAKESESP